MASERRKKDGLLPIVGIMYVDSAESQGVVGQRKKCLVQQLGRRICPESVLDCGCRIKLPVKFTVWEWQVAWWLW